MSANCLEWRTLFSHQKKIMYNFLRHGRIHRRERRKELKEKKKKKFTHIVEKKMEYKTMETVEWKTRIFF